MVMLMDTNKDTKIKCSTIINQNAGLSGIGSIFIPVRNKTPTIKYKTAENRSVIDYSDYIPNGGNGLAVYLPDTELLCIDIDGYSSAENPEERRTEKITSANKILPFVLEQIDMQTSRYRVDRTASKKNHIWVKCPANIRESIDLRHSFLSVDGEEASGIVEVFSKYDKHLVTLAGSKVVADDGSIKEYKNEYAGASFDQLAEVSDIKQIIINAVLEAGYLYNIRDDDVVTRTNVKYFRFVDREHTGYIKQYQSNHKYYYSYTDAEKNVIEKNFFVCSINEFDKNSISTAPSEYQCILLSIYYYTPAEESRTIAENTEKNNNRVISEKLVSLIEKYQVNTHGNRHYLLLAISNVLVEKLQFNKADLLEFETLLFSAVDFDIEHQNTILEGLKQERRTKYGIPKIVEILQCNTNELNFLFTETDNYAVKNELDYTEIIKPSITAEIEKGERKFQELFRLQKKGWYTNEENSLLSIQPTDNEADMIGSIIGNILLNEKQNTAHILLDFITTIAGFTRTIITVAGLSSGGKSTLVDTIKNTVIPDRYIVNIDDLSEKAFIRNIEQYGEHYYNNRILDMRDKGNANAYQKQNSFFGNIQSIITEGTYTYNVTANDKQGNAKGTIRLTIKVNGFCIINTTVTNPSAVSDTQIISRSDILQINNNSFEDIAEFQNRHKYQYMLKEVEAISYAIKSHILYRLHENKGDFIIVSLWHDYIKDLVLVNKGTQRKIDFLQNIFKGYCWININQLHQIKGTDEFIYYIPDSEMLESFFNFYSVNINTLNNGDIDFIRWLYDSNEYTCLKETAEITDIEQYNDRKANNVFTYSDIGHLLSKENEELKERLGNISELCKKMYNAGIFGRYQDTTKNRLVVYYLLDSSDISKINHKIDIENKHIQYAIEEMQYKLVPQEINKENYDKYIFKKPEKLFKNVKWDFIDARKTKENKNETGQRHSKEKTKQDTTANSTNVVNLHCHTDESTGDGAISIKELIKTAKENNQHALALTNHGTLNGLYRFNQLCKENNIKPILGIEAYVTKKRYHLVLLAKNYQGYRDLLEIQNSSVQYMKEHGEKRNDRYINGGIYIEKLNKDLCSNLIGLSACLSGQIPKLLLAGEYEEAKRIAIHYNTIFYKFYLEVQNNGLKKQEKLNRLLYKLSNDTGIPLTITGDVHYKENKDDWNAIKYAHKKYSKAPASNNAFMTEAPKELADTTVAIADMIEEYDIKTSLHIPKPAHNEEWMQQYCKNQLKELGIDDAEHQKRLRKEFKIITGVIADYCILLHEIIETIKPVVGTIGGRGSAVGSLVCYLLGFHEVDPLRYGLLFERFLNTERIEKALHDNTIDTSLLPDIDINISNNKRDKAFKTLEAKYGNIAKVITFAKLKPENKTIHKLKQLYPEANITGLKYISSQHAGGIIISTSKIDYLPLTLSRDGEIVTDCSLEEIEKRGGIKYDLLGETSTVINENITITPEELDRYARDIKKYPIGISQFTGYSARKYLRTHRIENFDDLLRATAKIRTGSNERWVFQEDMMLEATKYGISFADADYIRKPRGATKEEKEAKLNNIITRMRNNGCNDADAEAFRDYHNTYTFNKSHAVAYTIESCKNIKLKMTNPAEFYARRINQSKDAIAISELLNEAKKFKIEVIPPNRNYIKLNCTAKGTKLYTGTKLINGIQNNEPVDSHGKYKKVFKEYLNKSKEEQYYAIGTYNAEKLPDKKISLGFKTRGDRTIVATISHRGFRTEYFQKPTGNDTSAKLFKKGTEITTGVSKKYKA